MLAVLLLSGCAGKRSGGHLLEEAPVSVSSSAPSLKPEPDFDLVLSRTPTSLPEPRATFTPTLSPTPTNPSPVVSGISVISLQDPDMPAGNHDAVHRVVGKPNGAYAATFADEVASYPSLNRPRSGSVGPAALSTTGTYLLHREDNQVLALIATSHSAVSVPGGSEPELSKPQILFTVPDEYRPLVTVTATVDTQMLHEDGTPIDIRRLGGDIVPRLTVEVDPLGTVRYDDVRALLTAADYWATRIQSQEAAADRWGFSITMSWQTATSSASVDYNNLDAHHEGHY